MDNIKANEAHTILNTSLFHEAFDAVSDSIIEAIAAAPIEDAGLRNQLGLQLAAAREFKAQLFEHIETARLERDEEAQKAAEPKA